MAFLKWSLLALVIVVVIAVAAWMALSRYVDGQYTFDPLEIDNTQPVGPQVDMWLSGLHERDRFNGYVWLRKGEETLLRKTYGTADAAGERPLTDSTPLRIGSVSKMFTAVAVLALVEDGRLSLDSTLSDIIPECAYPDVTVRHLLTHVSGVRNDYVRLQGDPVTTSDVVTHVCAGPARPTSAPGEEHVYNNTGYVLLAGIVEAVSGQDFEDYVRESVLRPLGMNDSRVFNRLSPEVADAYVPGGGEAAAGVAETFDALLRPFETKPMTRHDGVAGDGALHVSLRDFESWERFWGDDRLISSALKAEAQSDLADGYGYGWVRQGDTVWHNGSWLGARSMYIRNMESGNVLVAVDNSDNYGFDAIVQQLSKALR